MRCLVFDLDDTLYEREQFLRGGLSAVAHYAASRVGVPAARAAAALFRAHRTAPGAELQALCRACGLPDDLIPELLHVFRTHRPRLTLVSGAAGMLRRLRRHGWRLVVLTNGRPGIQAAKVRALGLHEQVDHVLYAEEYAPGGKPDGAPFAEAARRAGVPPHRCVMVGDDPRCDIEGGARAGMWTIWVRRPGASEPGHASAAVRSVTEVPQIAGRLVSSARVHAA